MSPVVPTVPQGPRMSSLRLPVLALASLLAFPCLALAGPFDATRTTLRNGMQVVLSPDSLATTVDVALWFPAGSRHERAGQQGLALLAAQAAFRNGASDVRAPLEAVGGAGGLVTSADYTSFSATVPADAFAGALAFVAERTAGRTTTASDLATERAAIRDERARAERTPVQRALARLWAAAWPGHAYARIGALPDAGSDKLTPADVDAGRRTRLATSAAVFSVSGAFEPPGALAAVRERFEARPRVAVPVVAPVAPRAPLRATEPGARWSRIGSSRSPRRRDS
ncbi:MAG: M16 family metallopeptidase [bacterium]